MSYHKTQWKALGSMNNSQLKHLDILDELYLIFAEIGKIEKAYSDSLAQIEKKAKSLNDFGAMGKIFDMLAKNIKLKKDQHLILERIIKTIFNKEQLTVLQNNQFRNQVESHKEHTDFNEMVQCIENSKNEYHRCMENIEKSFIEELIKVTQAQIEPEVFEKKKAQFIETEKNAKVLYCERINEGNLIRDKYENQMNQILKDWQKGDELYLLTCSNIISSYFVNEKEVYKKISDSAFEIKDFCDKMDIHYEIEQYSKRNNRHGKPPKYFNFEVYNPSLNITDWLILNDKSNNLRQKSHRAILKDFFKKNFSYFPPEGIYDQTIVDNYKELENFVSNIWVDKCDPRKLTKIDQLFEESKMRNYFLKLLNQSRLKLPSLSEKSFDIMVHLMRVVLNESLKSEPYFFDSIHLTIILSQTFSKKTSVDNGEESQIFLQSELMKEKLWQNKEIWEGLIEYNYETEMNNDANVKKLSLEDMIIKEQSTIMIILTTFNFIMSSFGFDSKGVHEVISSYCLRFNIDEEKIKSIEC